MESSRDSGQMREGSSTDNINPSTPRPSRAIQIVSVSDEHSFELVEENLLSLLDREDVKCKPIVVMSVAGVYRKGKSFLLNFLIRYLSFMCKSEDFSDDGWLGDTEVPLEGFAWKNGAVRETSGILIWDEPFFVTTNDGTEVVVVLMDTQGVFDSESTVKECATIFALSTMLSSVQVYNLHSNINEDDLQHLQLFTNYGTLALVDSEENFKPFQSLLFLVRDWSYPYDYEYGMDGGNELLAKRLQPSASQHEELQLLRRQIRSFFERFDCFLMPYPGSKVATTKEFKGCLKDVDAGFIDSLGTLVPQLLSRDKLIVKKISGRVVTGQDLIEYFRAYMKVFQGDSLPEPKPLVQATAETNNLIALRDAMCLYKTNMDLICGKDKPYLDSNHLKEEHERFKQQAIEAFCNVKKMGGAEFSASYLEALDRDIMQAWENYAACNDSKKPWLLRLRTAITDHYYVSCAVPLLLVMTRIPSGSIKTIFVESAKFLWKPATLLASSSGLFVAIIGIPFTVAMVCALPMSGWWLWQQYLRRQNRNYR